MHFYILHQVLEGRQQFIEMAGNLIPVTKSGDQLFIDFKAFRENRLPCTVRIRDQDQESAARVAFMKEPKVARGEAPQSPICNLNITLPGWSKVSTKENGLHKLIYNFYIRCSRLICWIQCKERLK
jgi:ankyrin